MITPVCFFDSEDREGSLENKILKVEIADGFALNLEEDMDGVNQYSFPVEIDGQIVASIIIQYTLTRFRPMYCRRSYYT